jgi:hypothetical protein
MRVTCTPCDRQPVSNHGVELGNRESDGAVARETQHRPIRVRDLRAERKSETESHRAEKAVRDVAARARLPNGFVEPVIRLRAVADDDRVLRQVVGNRCDDLIRVNGRRRAREPLTESLAACGLRVLNGLLPVREIRPAPLVRLRVQRTQRFATIGNDGHSRVAQPPDFLRIDLHMNQLHAARHETIADAHREEPEAHAEREHHVRTRIRRSEIGELVIRAAI